MQRSRNTELLKSDYEIEREKKDHEAVMPKTRKK